MTTDKRTVSTDALEVLGTLIDEHVKRDAIHLAVEPMVAGQSLRPADWVKIVDGRAMLSEISAAVGIVDPFLEDMLFEGDGFLLIVRPRKITSLRHVWTHPDFPDTEDTISHSEESAFKSVQWLKRFALEEGEGYSYEHIMETAKESVGNGGYATIGNESLYLPEEFWDHYERATGTIVPNKNKYDYFGCAC